MYAYSAYWILNNRIFTQILDKLCILMGDIIASNNNLFTEKQSD